MTAPSATAPVSVVRPVPDPPPLVGPEITTDFIRTALLEADANALRIALYQATGDEKFLRYAVEWSESAKWQIPQNPLHADQICTGQTYLDLFLLKKDPTMIADLKALLEGMFTRATIKRAELGHALWNDT